MDVGIYCVRAAQYVTGLKPIAVTAKKGPVKNPEKFKGIEASVSWEMEFPYNIKAINETSYEQDMNLLRVDASRGWFELSPAYPYQGIKGKTSEKDLEFPQINQQARQMDDFAVAVSTSRPSPVPGEIGRDDVKIIMAIYQSMETGKRVEIKF